VIGGYEEEFASHGWTLVPDVIDAATVKEVQDALNRVYPTEDQLRAEPAAHSWVADGQFGGLRLWPLDDLLLDLLPVDHRIVAVVQQLMGTTQIQLLRAGYQAKYAGTADFDQVLHYDYPNHSLVVPNPDDVVGFFLYLSDVTEDLGPTVLVSDLVRGPITPEMTHPTPQDRPDLYAQARPAVGSAGSLLVYRSTTYHRGSAMTASAGVRLTLGFSYAQPAPWRGFLSFPRLGEESGLIRFMAAASPRQRELIGFPEVSDPYWTKETLEWTSRRFPGFDRRPYE
jgi:ectoine hydroxylase-related dioxygenase (phytanoyl-CoA dioxygenase family)